MPPVTTTTTWTTTTTSLLLDPAAAIDFLGFPSWPGPPHDQYQIWLSNGGAIGLNTRALVRVPNTRYGTGEVYREEPTNGLIYQIVTAGQTGPGAHLWASATNPTGIPKGFYRSAQYQNGERIRQLYFTAPFVSRRYRVSSPGTCITATTDPAYCTTPGCTFTSGSCNFTCDDGLCASGANAGHVCQTDMQCLGATCQLCTDSVTVNGVSVHGDWNWQMLDGTATISTWQNEPFNDIVTIRSSGARCGIELHNSDNQSGGGFCDSGSASQPNGNPGIYEHQSGKFRTLPYDPRIRNPAIYISNNGGETGGPSLSVARGGVRLINPAVPPILVPVVGGTLQAGCWVVSYAFEDGTTGGRTAESPRGYVYVDGTLRTAVSITTPPFPAGATKAWIYDLNLGGSACPDPVPDAWRDISLLLRSMFTQSPQALLTGRNGQWGAETEAAQGGYNTTNADLFAVYDGPGFGDWSATVYYTPNMNVRPTARWRSAHPETAGHSFLMYAACANTTCTLLDTSQWCTTGTTEPVWNLAAGAFTTDGSCFWREAGADQPTTLIRAIPGAATDVLQVRIGDRTIGRISPQGRLQLTTGIDVIDPASGTVLWHTP